MDILLALKEIKGRVKPHLHVGMPQSTFSTTIKHIELGLAKKSTVDSFMKKFGYVRIVKEDEWALKTL